MTNTEINKRIAVMLFGVKESDITTRHDGVLFKKDNSYPCGAGPLPDYCGTWEGLGKVVEAMRGKGFTIELDDMNEGPDVWSCHFWKEGTPVLSASAAPTAPKAVALAAISALESEETK